MMFRPRHYLAVANAVFLSYYIYNCGIDMVDQWSHMGHVIVLYLYDILRCRNSCKEQVSNLLCHFDKLDFL